MSMENYQNDFKDFTSLTGFPKNQILDIEFHPLENVLIDFFNYCKTTILRYSKKFDLNQTYFLYHESRNRNAAAKGYHTCNVIFITNGLFTDLYSRIYLSNIDFDKISFSQFQNLNQNTKDALGLLMFQSGMIFTFHHEFAHLVQRKDGNFEMNEYSNEEKPFNQYNHILEYDSDLNGCNFVLGLIDQYIEDHSNLFKTREDRLNLHWLALSSMIITMLLFLNNFEDSKANRNLYIKEKLHPHASVRISYIMEHYLFNMNVYGMQVTTQDGLNNCFRFCNDFFENKEIFKHYFEQLSDNLDTINEYCTELFDLATETPNLVRHQLEKFNL